MNEEFWETMLANAQNREGRKDFLHAVVDVCRFMYRELQSLCAPFLSEYIEVLKPSRIRALVEARQFNPVEKKLIISSALTALDGCYEMLGMDGSSISSALGVLESKMDQTRIRHFDPIFCIALQEAISILRGKKKALLAKEGCKQACPNASAVSYLRKCFTKSHSSKACNTNTEEAFFHQMVFSKTLQPAYRKEMAEGNPIMCYAMVSDLIMSVMKNMHTIDSTKKLPTCTMGLGMYLRSLRAKFDSNVLAAVNVATANMQALARLQTDTLAQLAIDSASDSGAERRLLRFCPDITQFQENRKPESELYKKIQIQMWRTWTKVPLMHTNHFRVRDILHLEDNNKIASKLLIKCAKKDGDGEVPLLSVKQQKQNLEDMKEFQLFCKTVFLVHGELLIQLMVSAALSAEID